MTQWETASRGCPPIDQLERYVSEGESDVAVQAHVATCPSCSTTVQAINRSNQLSVELRQAVTETDERVVESVPGYQLIEPVQSGAQGVVYRAIQLATKRQVAVKVLRAGAFATGRQRRRFEREVELAANLRHPNVVTIFDSGRTGSGGHFLAMEYVEGATLDDHLAAARASRTPARQRIARTLELFGQICGGVNAAHQRGIIHRDLKPDNILVDDGGAPKVLDFGLAKRQRVDEPEDALAATMAGEFHGTFAYAAPEQVSGHVDDVDVRSDVYALGVILYEMLTGTRPYPLGDSVADAVQNILHTEPVPPTRLDRHIDDDVETIVCKALSKRADQRYQSAGALRDDVEHVLNGEPINAKRDRHLYLLKKAIARYRIPIAAVTAFFVLTLVFAIVMTVLYRDSVIARKRADYQAQKATETLKSMLGVLGTAELRRRVGEDTIPQLLFEANRLVHLHLIDHPEAAAEISQQLGEVHLARSEYEQALTRFQSALAWRRAVDDVDPTLLADSLHRCGQALWWLERDEPAERRYGQALQIRRDVLGPRSEEVAMTMNHLGATLRRQGKYELAESNYQAALEIRRELYGSTHRLVAASLNSLAHCLRDQRKLHAAGERFEEALTMIRSVADDDHPWVAGGLHNLGMCRVDQGRLDEAQSLLEAAMELKQTLFEDNHASIATTRTVQGELNFQQGDLDGAEALVRGGLKVQLATAGGRTTAVADSSDLLGRILLAKEGLAEAELLLRRALDIRVQRLPKAHWKIAQSRSVLGECVARQGRREEAESLLIAGHRDLQASLAPTDAQVVAAAQRIEEFREKRRSDEATKPRRD